jgi:hypothetical protein
MGLKEEGWEKGGGEEGGGEWMEEGGVGMRSVHRERREGRGRLVRKEVEERQIEGRKVEERSGGLEDRGRREREGRGRREEPAK